MYCKPACLCRRWPPCVLTPSLDYGLQQELSAREDLGAGLHLIDFEQLKIENQSSNEKIEDRNEELLKYKKKIHTMVQVLTHMREKLDFTHGENESLSSTVKEIESQVAKKRDVLSRLKVRGGYRNAVVASTDWGPHVHPAALLEGTHAQQ